MGALECFDVASGFVGEVEPTPVGCCLLSCGTLSAVHSPVTSLHVCPELILKALVHGFEREEVVARGGGHLQECEEPLDFTADSGRSHTSVGQRLRSDAIACVDWLVTITNRHHLMS